MARRRKQPKYDYEKPKRDCYITKVDDDLVGTMVEQSKDVQLEDETVREIVKRSRVLYKELRRWPDEIKVLAIVLRTSGYTISHISAILGVSETCIVDWSKRPTFDSVSLQEVSQGIKDSLAPKLIMNANLCFEMAMNDDKLKKASTLQLVTAASIMVDKARLLSNESTENIAVYHKRITDTVRKRDDLGKSVLEQEVEMAAIEAEMRTLQEAQDSVDNL